VRGIKECNGFLGVHSGKFRWLWVHHGADEVGRWKGCVWLGPTTNNAPVFCSSEAFRHFLKHGKVMVVWARGELRQRNGGAANVWLTRDMSMWWLAKERATGKTMLGCQGSMFGNVLWRARMGTDGGHCICWQRGGRLRWDRRRRFGPSMSGQDTVDVLLTRELVGVRMLRNIKSVEVFDEAEALEWGGVFRWQLQGFANLTTRTLGNVFVGARHSKIVNLAQQEHFGTLKDG